MRLQQCTFFTIWYNGDVMYNTQYLNVDRAQCLEILTESITMTLSKPADSNTLTPWNTMIKDYCRCLLIIILKNVYQIKQYIVSLWQTFLLGVKSYQIESYLMSLYHITSLCVKSCAVFPAVLSYLILSFPVLSFSIPSYPILPVSNIFILCFHKG